MHTGEVRHVYSCRLVAFVHVDLQITDILASFHETLCKSAADVDSMQNKGLAFGGLVCQGFDRTFDIHITVTNNQPVNATSNGKFLKRAYPKNHRFQYVLILRWPNFR